MSDIQFDSIEEIAEIVLWPVRERCGQYVGISNTPQQRPIPASEPLPSRGKGPLTRDGTYPLREQRVASRPADAKARRIVGKSSRAVLTNLEHIPILTKEEAESDMRMMFIRQFALACNNVRMVNKDAPIRSTVVTPMLRWISCVRELLSAEDLMILLATAIKILSKMPAFSEHSISIRWVLPSV